MLAKLRFALETDLLRDETPVKMTVRMPRNLKALFVAYLDELQKTSPETTANDVICEAIRELVHGIKPGSIQTDRARRGRPPNA